MTQYRYNVDNYYEWENTLSDKNAPPFLMVFISAFSARIFHNIRREAIGTSAWNLIFFVFVIFHQLRLFFSSY